MEVYKKVRAYIEVDFDAMMNGEKTMYADDLRAICLALNVSPEIFIEVDKE